MSANIDSDGRVRQLDRRAEPDEQVQEDEVKDPPRLVRLIMRMLRDIALLKRRWRPRRIDFEDVRVTGGGGDTFRFAHGFGGRVRWWVVDWQSTSAEPPGFDRDVSSDDNTLALVSYAAGIVTIRVEEAG